MKSIMKLSLLVCTLFLLCTVTSCKHEHGPDTHTHNADGTIDKSGPEWTSDYVCPMHCKGSGSNAEGTCPVCKMKLVKNKDKAVDHSGHDHSGHDHDGHDHSHDGHDHSHDGHDHSGHDH